MGRSLRVIAASALPVLCGTLALSRCSGSTGSNVSSPVNTASAGAETTDPVITDLRSTEEFKKGYLEGAVDYDFSSGDFSNQISGLDRSSQYQLHGPADRPRMANTVMHNAGFSNATELGTLDVARKTTGARVVTD